MMLPEQNSCDYILVALTSIGVITDFEIRIYSGGFRKSSPCSTSHRDSNQHWRGRIGRSQDLSVVFLPCHPGDFPVE